MSDFREQSEAGATADAGPSSWAHRLPIVGLALLGCALSAYLTLYQWHVTSSVWDPIFGAQSSEAVLTSFLSRWLPLPDATLGGIAYLGEALLTAVGGSQRWRRHPWLVSLYGLALLSLALTSVALVLIQVFVVQALCSLCLCSAAISLVTAGLGRGEVFASWSHWRQASLERASATPGRWAQHG